MNTWNHAVGNAALCSFPPGRARVVGQAGGRSRQAPCTCPRAGSPVCRGAENTDTGVSHACAQLFIPPQGQPVS